MSTATSLLSRVWPSRARPSAAAPHAATAAATPAASGSATGPAPTATASSAWARVLFSGAHCPAGDTAAALLQASREGRPLPQVHNTLSHADGLPVMGLPLPPLSLDDWDLALTQARAALPLDHPLQSPVPARLQRALAALQRPLSQALQQAEPWRQPGPPAADTAAHNDFGLQRLAPTPPTPPAPTRPQPALRVLAAWPPTWSGAERRLATAWLQQQLGPAPGGPGLPCQATALHAGELLRQAHHHMADMARLGEADLLLLLACHSDLDDDTVQQLGHAGELFHAASCPQGRVASEAAAALLLAPVDLPAPPQAGPLPTTCLLSLAVSPPPAAALPAAAAAAPVCDEAGLTEVCRQALAAAGLAADALDALVADASHHGPGVHALCAGSAALGLPADPRRNVHLTGPVAGQGPTSALLVLAAAVARCEEARAPCLAVVLGHAPLQVAAVMASVMAAVDAGQEAPQQSAAAPRTASP